MWQLKNNTTGELHNCDAQPQWIDSVWECGSFRITDIAGVDYSVVAPAAIPPKVSPIEFKLLFTSGERIAIKSSTDPVVQDFYEITNDPRLTHVDLGIKSTQDAIAYLVHVGVLTQERADAIKSGEPA